MGHRLSGNWGTERYSRSTLTEAVTPTSICGNLQIDVGVTASVRVDREYLSVPQFPDNLCPIRRKARRRGDSRKVQLTCRRELTKTRAVRVLDEQCALKVGCCVIGVPLHAFPHKQKLSPIR